VIQNNKEIFEKNGFFFEIIDKEEGKILKLNKLPVSKGIEFSLEDFLELVQELENNSLDAFQFSTKKIQK